MTRRGSARIGALAALGAALAALPGCPSTRTVPPEPPPEVDFAPTVILISVDGFRHDYPGRAETPTLDRLAAEGVQAGGLIPVFPSKTFPNHYSLVTGLYAEGHGIVNNTFYDPARDDWFSMSDERAVQDGTWWGGEPIWSTAVKQGQRAATCFWPGSEAEIAGARPSLWLSYDGGMSWEARVAQVLAWLDLPDGERPTFLTLYLEEPDGSGHSHGPDGAEVESAAAEVDAALGLLVEGLEARGALDAVDLIVVSDHGMAGTSDERLVMLDERIDVDALEITSWGTQAAIWPEDDAIDGVVAALEGLEGATCARKEDLPEALRYADHERIAPVICVAEVGWSITTRQWAEDNPGYYDGGTHGYDPAAEEMWGIFVARGPRLVEGARPETLRAVDVYGLTAAILGLEPAPNDGDPAAIEALLR